MIEVLRNKNLTTKFQILAEIADRGPEIQQREIARKLDITPQAVSDYISQLIKDDMLISRGRSSYKVTNEGINWVIKELKELNNYSISIQRAVNSISVSAAIAADDLEKDQRVGLKMKDGLLFATSDTEASASGVATTAAKAGDDIGISDIRGIVSLVVGKVVIAIVPGIEKGGSGKVNYDALKRHITGSQFIVSMGLESYATLKKSGVDFYQFGAIEAAIEAAKCGLKPLVVCVENEASRLISRLEQERITYELREVSKK